MNSTKKISSSTIADLKTPGLSCIYSGPKQVFVFYYLFSPFYRVFFFSKENAVTLLRKTTTFLSKMNSSESKVLQVRKQINVNIVTSIGNVLASSSKGLNIDFENETLDIDKEKVRHFFYLTQVL